MSSSNKRKKVIKRGEDDDDDDDDDEVMGETVVDKKMISDAIDKWLKDEMSQQVSSMINTMETTKVECSFCKSKQPCASVSRYNCGHSACFPCYDSMLNKITYMVECIICGKEYRTMENGEIFEDEANVIRDDSNMITDDPNNNNNNN